MGKKGGETTQTSRVELPPEIRRAAIDNLNIADEVAALGYVPNTGPTIAGFAPQQIAAMQGIDQSASAFGMPSAVNWQRGAGGSMKAPNGMNSDAMYKALTGMDPPTSTAGGMTGYSGYGIMQDLISNMAPGQRAAIESFVMDPVTGAPPTNSSVPRPGNNLRVPVEYGRTPEERRVLAAAAGRSGSVDPRRSAPVSTSVRDRLAALISNGGFGRADR